MKAIVICRSDSLGKLYAIGKIRTSAEEVMEYLAKCKPNRALIYRYSFMDNRQFVMPDYCYDSLEEWIDSHPTEIAELDHIYLKAVNILEDGTHTIDNYIIHATNLY